MQDPTNTEASAQQRPMNGRPDEPWQISHARAALAKSKAADSTPQNAGQHWGRLEAVLEALLDHLDRQGGAR